MPKLGVKFCKICKIEFKPIRDTQQFCSNKCKFSDKEYNVKRVSCVKNTNVEKLISKLDNWETTDILNKSGSIKKYLTNKGIIFDKTTYLNYFNKEKVIKIEKLKCPLCNWETNDILNKGGHFSNHIKNIHNDISINEFVTKYKNFEMFFKKHIEKEKYDNFIDSSAENKIQCMECNNWFKSISSTHLKTHNLTPIEYKNKYNITTICSKFTENKLRKNSYSFQKDGILKRIDNANCIPLFDINTYDGVVQNKKYNFQCKKCHFTFEHTLDDGKSPICRICYPKLEFSPNKKLETEIFNFLKELNITNILTNDRTVLGKKELDFYLPDYKVGIEINGLYWHSEIYKDKKYHLEKTNLSISKNIRLIQIFEDEWLDNKTLVKSKIQHILNLNYNKKIFARKCKILEISNETCQKFLEKNHLQGNDNSKYKYGLFYENLLVSVITFSKPRIFLGKYKNKEFLELSRFCSDIDYNVIGGFSKLLKYFLNLKLTNKIISYADLRWTSEFKNVYEKNNFKLISKTTPNYFWVKGLKRHYRFKFNKQNLIKMGHDKNKTEIQIMHELNYTRIWDCGHLKYELTF